MTPVQKSGSLFGWHGASSVVIADFNGDGKPDVAVANLKDSTVSLLLGNGDGTLQPAVVYLTGAGPESLAAVAQGKGAADLVAANGNGGTSPMGTDVTVLQNMQQQIGTTMSTLPDTLHLSPRGIDRKPVRHFHGDGDRERTDAYRECDLYKQRIYHP